MEKIALLFPGQGAQFIKMGQYFYDEFLIARQTYEEASAAFGKDVAKLCFEGKLSEINDFKNMQVCILTTSVAMFRVYMEKYKVPPHVVAGHSIGEYSAIVCSGAMTLSDAIRILKIRGDLVKRIVERNMARMTIVEKTNKRNILEVMTEGAVKDKVFLACENSVSQYAISGYNEEMDQIERALVNQGAQVTPLMFSPPMHSAILEEIRSELKSYLEMVKYYPMKFPIIANLTGKPFSNSYEIPDLLSKQLVSTVKWQQTIQSMYKYGITMTIEMSPKILLSHFVKEELSDVKTFCYGQKRDSKELEELFNQDDSYRKDMPHFIGTCLRIIAATPNFNYQTEHYTKHVVEPYKELKKVYLETKENDTVNIQQQQWALDMLVDILHAKRVPENEIYIWVKQLLDETNTYYVFSDFLKNLN